MTELLDKAVANAVPQGASFTEGNGQNPTPVSGAIMYRVIVRTSVGMLIPVDVMAIGGDDAATKALAQAPGGFVSSVNPAPPTAKAV